MKTENLLIGGVMMAFLVIRDATGQISPLEAANPVDRSAAALRLIKATLGKAFQEKNPAEQITHYQKTRDQVLKLCPTNLVVTQVLQSAMSKAADARDDRHAARLLREGLREAQATLAFKPFIETPLPEGFPKPTSVGEIQIKQYPKYRLARTQMAGAETGAFWTLFTHIKKKDIAMTAPVEMTYSAAVKDKLKVEAMAFLYRSTNQGQAGKDENVEVIDVLAMTALSFGIRGDVTKARLAEAKSYLDAWLEEHADNYEASGPLRVMGYNSPFVSANRRFTEVELPVRQTVPAR